jgi:hypothetical protein
MKFLVEVTAPADKGHEIDAAGGPGPIVADLMARFKPEIMYGAADCRTLTFVADLGSEHEIAVLMEICSDRLYAYPHLRPVISADQMPEFVRAVHAETGVH